MSRPSEGPRSERARSEATQSEAAQSEAARSETTQPEAALDLRSEDPRLLIVVGSGGVGKTTLAAALGLASARAGYDTLVMTFDPSLRLKDALGVGGPSSGEDGSGGEGEEGPRTDEEIEVPLDALGPSGEDGPAPGRLYASLLDAGKTFDRLVERYAPDQEARDRILGNRYYRYMASHLGGILEYMAVERLYEVATEGRYQRIILDTPPTAQAIDFLQAPGRVTSFLDSGALEIALRPWFDDGGKLKVTSKLGFVGRSVEGFLDRIVGVELLRDMSEFFQAFAPLFDGFAGRASKVEAMLAEPDTRFLLVTGPGEARIPDTLFFARRLVEAGYALGPLVVNRVHPTFGPPRGAADGEGHVVRDPAEPVSFDDGADLFRWLGESHRRGLAELRRLLPEAQRVVPLPVEADEPTDLPSLAAMGERLAGSLAEDS